MQLNLGDNIKKYRKEMDLTQEGLAEAFSVTVGAVSKWESGSTVPDITTLIELADFFGISLDVLLGYSTSSKSIEAITDRLDQLLRENKFDELIEEADKALIRYPGNFKIIHSCAKRYHVVSAVGGYKKYRQKTIDLYKSALKYIDQNTDPDISEFSIRLSIADLKSQVNPKGALEDFKKINYLGIADAQIAMMYMNLGQLDDARDRYTRMLVSILVKSLQYAGNLAVANYISGKKNDIREACDLLDWCMTIFDATSCGRISYLTKMKIMLLILKSMGLSALGEYDDMRLCIDKANELAIEYDNSPSNTLEGGIRFWHVNSDFKPIVYDELGQGAVNSIDTMFDQKSDPIPRNVFKKMEKAREYWNSIKT